MLPLTRASLDGANELRSFGFCGVHHFSDFTMLFGLGMRLKNRRAFLSGAGDVRTEVKKYISISL